MLAIVLHILFLFFCTAGDAANVYEGVAGRCYANPEEGSVPLFRYYNAETNDHFYTENWSEIEAGEYGYAYEGIVCYISPVARQGTLAFLRYWSPQRTDHFYTTDSSELGAGQKNGFISERIPGWICPRVKGDKPIDPCHGALGLTSSINTWGYADL